MGDKLVCHMKQKGPRQIVFVNRVLRKTLAYVEGTEGVNGENYII
jgi:hypothetical protein